MEFINESQISLIFSLAYDVSSYKRQCFYANHSRNDAIALTWPASLLPFLSIYFKWTHKQSGSQLIGIIFCFNISPTPPFPIVHHSTDLNGVFALKLINFLFEHWNCGCRDAVVNKCTSAVPSNYRFLSSSVELRPQTSPLMRISLPLPW